MSNVKQKIDNWGRFRKVVVEKLVRLILLQMTLVNSVKTNFKTPNYLKATEID